MIEMSVVRLNGPPKYAVILVIEIIKYVYKMRNNLIFIANN